MKNKYVFVLVLLCVLSLASFSVARFSRFQAEKDDETVIVTSFYPMYIAALNLTDGMDDVRVESLTQPATGCLHDYQLTPKDMKLLSTADILVVNGGGMEQFLDDVLKQYPSIHIISASDGIDLLEASQQEIGPQNHGTHTELDHVEDESTVTEPTEDKHTEDEHTDSEHSVDDHTEDQHTEDQHTDAEHAEDEHTDTEHAEDESTHDHSHGTYNSHVWMDLLRYSKQITNIANGLASVDEVHAVEYENNNSKYQSKINELNVQAQELKQQKQNVIVFHDAFAYFADMLGYPIQGTLDMDDNTSLSASQISLVMDRVKSKSVHVLFAEERYGKKLAQAVESETDGKVLLLDTLVSGDKDKDAYLNGMKHNLELVKEALQK